MLIPITALVCYLLLVHSISHSLCITATVFLVSFIVRHAYLISSAPHTPTSRSQYESIPAPPVDGWDSTAHHGTSRRMYPSALIGAFSAVNYRNMFFSPASPARYNLSHLVHPNISPFLNMSATQLAQALRNKQVSCVDLIQLHIKHILQVNRYINAMVHHRFDLALREATAADHVLSKWDGKQKLPPFLGVPCSSKECLELAGFPQTSGLIGRLSYVSTCTAPIITRMQQAGFIVMGTTNTSELCMWFESNNFVYGCTLNPYDLSRIPGGSSGGEGAIVAACGVPVGIGSDVGGSIRMPAFFNGIFGHKPTGGTVPNTGQHPKHVGAIERYCQAGPLCRYAEDLWPLLRIMAGPDDTSNPYQHRPQWLDDETIHPKQVDISSLTVLSLIEIDSPLISRLHPELRAAQARCEEHFKSLGATIKRIKIDEMKQAFFYWSSILSIEHPIPFRIQLSENLSAHRTWYTRMLSTSHIWIAYEIFVLMFQWPQQAAFTLPALFLSWLEMIPEYFPHHSAIQVARGRAFIQHLHDMLMGNKHVDDITHVTKGYDSWGHIQQQQQQQTHISPVSQVNFSPPPTTTVKHRKQHTIMLCPSHPVMAPPHHWSVIRPFNCIYTAVFNVSQLPVTQVPLGLSDLSSGSLPLGVQVIAAFGLDHVTIAAALQLERAFGGYTHPSIPIPAIPAAYDN